VAAPDRLALRAGDPYQAAAFRWCPIPPDPAAASLRGRGRRVRPIGAERHAIHGHGWQARWQPTDVRAAEARSNTGILPERGRVITPRSTSRWRRRPPS
jgi:hypothetical protein